MRQKPNHALPLQGLSAVRDWNFWLSACASLPFCALKPGADPVPGPETDDLTVDVGVGAADVLSEDMAAGDAGEGAGEGSGFLPLPLPAPLPEGTPGDETKSTSCDPSAIGPEVCAGQLPAGFRTAFWPNGIVPGAPALRLPVNWVGSAPWNWHWKSPSSSAFRGACWQYCTLRELGWCFTKRINIW
jgi:hypothetical protein